MSVKTKNSITICQVFTKDNLIYHQHNSLTPVPLYELFFHHKFLKDSFEYVLLVFLKLVEIGFFN